MELKKKKFKREEVEKIIAEISQRYENNIGDLKDKNAELLFENNNLKSEIEFFKLQEQNVLATLKNANIKANEIEKEARLQYYAEIETLKKFSEKWQDYFFALKEKYPHYPAINKAIELKDKINLILKRESGKQVIENLEKEFSDNNSKNNKVFAPKEKIQDYIASTSDSGFNLDEVLNPGELELEDLCKELGLMEEEIL